MNKKSLGQGRQGAYRTVYDMYKCMEVGNQKQSQKETSRSVWMNENTREVWKGSFNVLNGLKSSVQTTDELLQWNCCKNCYGQKIWHSKSYTWEF